MNPTGGVAAPGKVRETGLRGGARSGGTEKQGSPERGERLSGKPTG